MPVARYKAGRRLVTRIFLGLTSHRSRTVSALTWFIYDWLAHARRDVRRQFLKTLRSCANQLV